MMEAQDKATYCFKPAISDDIWLCENYLRDKKKTKKLKLNFKRFFIEDILIALEFKRDKKCYWF